MTPHLGAVLAVAVAIGAGIYHVIDRLAVELRRRQAQLERAQLPATRTARLEHMATVTGQIRRPGWPPPPEHRRVRTEAEANRLLALALTAMRAEVERLEGVNAAQAAALARRTWDRVLPDLPSLSAGWRAPRFDDIDELLDEVCPEPAHA